jgi:uncharacterized protein YndB with AHSA1/START domain
MAKHKTEVSATPGGREVIITREFDFPREKIWQAYTDPELVVQWLGPRRMTGKIEAWDIKPGGKWALIHTDEAGNDYNFHGYTHQAVKPERMVRTFEYEGAAGHISLETLQLADLGNGHTKVTTIAVFQTVEDRDFMIQSGMEGGVSEGNERLDELLKTLHTGTI